MSQNAKEYKKIKEYVIEEINKVRLPKTTGVSGGGVGGSGGASTHSLSGSSHSGTLADAQAPQFLMVDGTRQLNGNLPVAALVTIDGVDISAHAADVNAHHAAVTAGDGISLVGQEVSVNASDLADGDFGIEVFSNDFRIKFSADGGLTLAGGLALSLASPSGLQIVSNELAVADTIAGGGLTITGKILAVGAGDGITVGADSVAVDGTVLRTTRNIIAGAGLTGGGTLAADVTLNVGAGDGLSVGADTVGLTTPGSVSASSTNNPTGNHTHAVTASDNPGAAVSLLRSTAAGGLTLESLNVDGAVTIGQGIIAGDSGFRVIHHTHDADHVHVVVNPTIAWSLDEQFGVDIDDNLLVRGWIVGKHAIQLPGAVAIYHFDGPDTNTGGEDRSHMGQVPLVNTNGPTFVRGKFGRALSFGPGAVALITNNSFETDLSGWTAVSLTMSRVAKDAFHGGWQMQLSASAGGQAAYTSASANTVISTNYLFSVWLKGSADTPARIAIQNNAGTVTYGSATITVTDEWKLFACTGAASEANAARCIIFVDDPVTIWADGAQLYEGFSTSLSFVAGSRGGASYLQYATQGMLPNVGSVMFWARPATNTAGVDQFAFVCETDASNRIEIFVENASQKWRLNLAGASATSTAVAATGEWSHICVTWNSGTARLFVDGLQQGADHSFTPFASLATSYFIGYNANPFRGEIDDVVIANRAITADEVRAIYESNAPVFGETSTFQFRVGRNRVYGDAEGLWVLNYAGQAAFAVYSGDDDGTGSKSWGGVTLNASDILMGDSTRGGYVKWDDSLSTLEVKGRILLQSSSTGIANFTDAGALATANNLDGVPNGTTYSRVLTTAISAGNIKLDEVVEGTYARVLTTDITAGHIKLDETVDGTYGKVRSTIIAAGLIQVGSGTKDSSLNGWNISSTEIVGQASGVDQVAMGTDGKMIAGAGNVILDADGISIKAGTSIVPQSSIKFTNSSLTIHGYVTGELATGANSMYVTVLPIAGRNGVVQLSSNSPLGKEATINLISAVTTGATATIIANAQDASSTIQLASTTILLSGNTTVTGTANFDAAVTFDTTIGVTGNAIFANAGFGGITSPTASVHAARGAGAGGTAIFQGSSFNSIFNSDTAENTFIRSGKGGAYVAINDDHAGEVLIGTSGGTNRVGIGIGIATPGGKLTVNQGLSTAAIPTLELQQDDGSEEFINFITTVGAGNPIDGAAIGAYYARARVAVNGTFKYLALYDA